VLNRGPTSGAMGIEAAGDEKRCVLGKWDQRNGVPCWVQIGFDGTVALARGGQCKSREPAGCVGRRRFSFADMTTPLSLGKASAGTRGELEMSHLMSWEVAGGWRAITGRKNGDYDHVPTMAHRAFAQRLAG